MNGFRETSRRLKPRAVAAAAVFTCALTLFPKPVFAQIEQVTITVDGMT